MASLSRLPISTSTGTTDANGVGKKIGTLRLSDTQSERFLVVSRCTQKKRRTYLDFRESISERSPIWISANQYLSVFRPRRTRRRLAPNVRP